MEQLINLTFHHTGLAVSDMDETIAVYTKIFGEQAISVKYKIVSQDVTVCFVKIGENSFLELIEPLSEQSSIHRLLKKGIAYYHNGYQTNDIEKSVNQLIQLNFKPLDYFTSEAFDNKRCIFLFSPTGHLIELIENGNDK